MSQKINCEYEPGIWTEVTFYLDQNKEKFYKQDFTFNQSDKCYNVKIMLKAFSRQKAREVLYSLLQFISYSNVFYVRELFKGRIDYYVLSSSDNETGFFLHIVFIDNPRNEQGVESNE